MFPNILPCLTTSHGDRGTVTSRNLGDSETAKYRCTLVRLGIGLQNLLLVFSPLGLSSRSYFLFPITFLFFFSLV